MKHVNLLPVVLLSMAALTLAACDRPTVVTTPAVVTVPALQVRLAQQETLGTLAAQALLEIPAARVAKAKRVRPAVTPS